MTVAISFYKGVLVIAPLVMSNLLLLAVGAIHSNVSASEWRSRPVKTRAEFLIIPIAATQAVQEMPSKQSDQAGNDQAERDAILQTIDNWAKAWSSKDLAHYFSFYSNDFQTPNGISRPQWVAGRRANVRSKTHIDVKVISPVVIIRGHIAAVQFQQAYVSDQFTDLNRKTLMLIKRDNKWQIIQELSGK